MTEPVPTCPLCAEPLQPVLAGDEQTPPWLCTSCCRGWWPPELTPAARDAIRPGLRDFGVDEPGQMVELATQVYVEQNGVPSPGSTGDQEET